MISRADLMRWIVGSVLLAAALLFFARCDLMEPAEAERLVVEAFFQSGRPLGAITLRSTRPLDAPAGDTATRAAQDAEVMLQLDGTSIPYYPVEDMPGQYAPDTSVMVSPRAAFTLAVQWRGQQATATGAVPPPIRIEDARIDVPSEPVQAILVDSLRRDSLQIPAEQGYIYPIEVTVTWATDFREVGSDSTYWIRTQLKPYAPFNSRVVDFFLQPEEVFRERTARRRGSQRRWTGVYAVPVTERDDPLPRHELRVALVRGGPEYAAFATSRGDPERREPISNLQGAAGVAAAIALDSVRVAVGEAMP